MQGKEALRPKGWSIQIKPINWSFYGLLLLTSLDLDSVGRGWRVGGGIRANSMGEPESCLVNGLGWREGPGVGVAGQVDSSGVSKDKTTGESGHYGEGKLAWNIPFSPHV